MQAVRKDLVIVRCQHPAPPAGCVTPAWAAGWGSPTCEGPVKDVILLRSGTALTGPSFPSTPTSTSGASVGHGPAPHGRGIRRRRRPAVCGTCDLDPFQGDSQDGAAPDPADLG